MLRGDELIGPRREAACMQSDSCLGNEAMIVAATLGDSSRVYSLLLRGIRRLHSWVICRYYTATWKLSEKGKSSYTACNWQATRRWL